MKRRKSNISVLLSIVIVLITISITIAVVLSFKDDSLLDNIVGIVAIITGISGGVLGIVSLRTANLENVREYFQTGDTKEMIYNRSVLYEFKASNKSLYEPDFFLKHYDINNNPSNLKMKDIELSVSKISSFFHLWGLLAKKGYLPLWVFESASGIAVCRLYYASIEVINNKRKKNPLYAENFEWLTNKIIEKYQFDEELYK